MVKELKEYVSLRVPKTLHTKLVELAKQNERSLTAQIVFLLKKSIK